MFDRRLRRALLAGTAAGVLLAGPALAQEEQCAQRLDQIEQQLGQAELDPQRQEDINQVVEGARLLADTGDAEGCMNVVAELDDLMTTLQEAGQMGAAQGDQEAGQDQAGSEQPGGASGEMAQAGGQSQAGAQAQEEQIQAGAMPASEGETSTQQMAEPGDQPQTDDQQQVESTGQPQEESEVTARVTIDQPQPQVLVKQKPPKITVRIPKPIVTVRLPQPEVQIEMPDPEVQVEQVDPDIQVVMGQPDLQVRGTQGQNEQGQQQVPAEVQFERDQQQQAEVEVLTEEPEVRVEQEDANVQIGQSDQPQGQQQMAAAGGDEATPPQSEPSAQPGRQAMGQEEQAGEQDSQSGQQAGEAGTELPQSEPEEEQQAASGDEQPAMPAESGSESPEEQAQVTEENPLAALPASDVIGSEVQNQEGDTVAEIVDLVKRQGQEDLYAVLSVGGFLGIGGKEVLVPVNDLQVGQEGEIVMANASEEQLKEMPEYQDEGYESTAQLEQPPAQQ